MKKRALQRGGAHLKKERTSKNLNYDQCENLIDAVLVAWNNGHPFNRFITILWERGGIDPRNNTSATGHFIKLACDWARRHGYRLFWAWVQEYGSKNGMHVHILLNVPPELNQQFRAMPMRWVKSILPNLYIPKILRSDRVGSDKMPYNCPQSYQAMLMAKVHYMLKCASAKLEYELDMTMWRTPFSKNWGQNGIVFGKRLGIWQGWLLG